MAEELFDVVDEADRPLFVALRSQVHANQWLHRAAQIFVFNSRGELLVHQRSASKDEYPGRWNTSASGHLHAGEDYDTAAERELQEELGLSGKLERLQKFPASVVTSHEHTVLYRLITDVPPRFDPEEIAAGGFYSLSDLTAWVDRESEAFTPCFRMLLQWYVRPASHKCLRLP